MESDLGPKTRPGDGCPDGFPADCAGQTLGVANLDPSNEQSEACEGSGGGGVCRGKALAPPTLAGTLRASLGAPPPSPSLQRPLSAGGPSPLSSRGPGQDPLWEVTSGRRSWRR